MSEFAEDLSSSEVDPLWEAVGVSSAEEFNAKMTSLYRNKREYNADGLESVHDENGVLLYTIESDTAGPAYQSPQWVREAIQRARPKDSAE